MKTILITGAALLALVFFASCTRPKIAMRSEMFGAEAQYQAHFPLIVSNAVLSTPPSAIRGIAGSSCADLVTLGGQWTYTWAPNDPQCPGVEQMPMIPNAQFLDSQVGPGEWLLVFNEPDLSGWDHLNYQSPETAAVNWRYLEQRFPDKKFAGPAASELHPEWVTQWRSAYMALYGTPPRLDALTWHCYAGWPACKTLGDYYLVLAETWEVPLWLTEWAIIKCNNPDWQDEMRSMLDWADAYMSRHAWFTSRILVSSPWSLGCDTGLLDYYTGELSDQGAVWLEGP